MLKKLNFVTGFITGCIFATLAAGVFAAMSNSRTDREFEKFSETSDGKTAVLITIVE